VVDIAVPYADENRNRALHDAWRRQAGEALPAPPLLLPRRSEGAYRVRIRAQNVLGIPVEDQYSDAVAGETGGPAGHHGELIIAHVVLSGEWRFTSRNQHARAGAGTLSVRRNEVLWGMEAVRGTRAIAVGLPASAVRFPPNTLAVTAGQTTPAARLLLAQLRLLADVAHDLGPAAGAARDATFQLFQGLVNEQVVDDAEFAPALLEAARRYIEDRLLDDPDLDARAVAEALHVSVRTLYRAFARHSTTSVMAYIRQRRLERARAELNSTRLTVSETAARWHFADGSHFAKAYKKHFGETPSAGRGH
jgi:AraC-like DNA-binding protein